MSDGGLWTPALTRWVDAVAETWRAFGMAPETITRLRVDLIHDLMQARRDGASALELTSPVPMQFAADVAAAEGLDQRTPAAKPIGRRRTGVFRVIDASLAGVIIGLALSLVTVYPVGFQIISTGQPDGPLMLLLHLLSAATSLVGAGVAVRFALRRNPNARRVAIAVTSGLTFSGVVATLATTSYAASTEFSTDAGTVAREVVLVLTICTAGLATTAHMCRTRKWLDDRPDVAANSMGRTF